MRTFGARLHDALHDRGPLCVGIDPHPELLREWGLPADVSGLARFADVCVQAFGEVAMVKPQVAFFELHGSAGYVVLERTIAALREAGTLVLADAKRGDIGTTMAAYAQAWLGDGPLASDAMTVSPYLGFGSLDPALNFGPERGAFVLAATSNPEGGLVQRAVVGGGPTVDQTIVDEAAFRNAGAQPLGSVGVVVGATLSEAPDVSALNGPVLMPGVGAQGGGPDDVRRLVGDNLSAVVPSVSREVLRAGPSIPALRDAVGRITESFAFLQA